MQPPIEFQNFPVYLSQLPDYIFMENTMGEIYIHFRESYSDFYYYGLSLYKQIRSLGSFETVKDAKRAVDLYKKRNTWK